MFETKAGARGICWPARTECDTRPTFRGGESVYAGGSPAPPRSAPPPAGQGICAGGQGQPHPQSPLGPRHDPRPRPAGLIRDGAGTGSHGHGIKGLRQYDWAMMEVNGRRCPERRTR